MKPVPDTLFFHRSAIDGPKRNGTEPATVDAENPHRLKPVPDTLFFHRSAG